MGEAHYTFGAAPDPIPPRQQASSERPNCSFCNHTFSDP